MPPQSHDRLRKAGGQVMAARQHLAMNRAALAQAAAVSQKSLARLEGGEEVRLSTYLAVVDYVARQPPAVAGLTERVAALTEGNRALVLEFVAKLERNQRS